jgi:hypothetical protein
VPLFFVRRSLRLRLTPIWRPRLLARRKGSAVLLFFVRRSSRLLVDAYLATLSFYALQRFVVRFCIDSFRFFAAFVAPTARRLFGILAWSSPGPRSVVVFSRASVVPFLFVRHLLRLLLDPCLASSLVSVLQYFVPAAVFRRKVLQRHYSLCGAHVAYCLTPARRPRLILAWSSLCCSLLARFCSAVCVCTALIASPARRLFGVLAC